MLRDLELREGWATVVLMLLMLLMVAWSIQSARWTDGLAILQAVIVVAGLFGIVLAKSRVPNRLAHALSLLAGLTWAAYLTSRALAPAAGLTAEAAVLELEQRFVNWIFVVFNGGTSSGNFVFLLLLSLLMWLMAYVVAWAIFRWQRVWWAVILCGVALVINLTYAPNNLTGFFVAYLLFALLLVVRTSLASYEQEWRSARVGYSPELVYGFFRAGLVVAILAIGLAWIAPQALASRPMQDALDKVGEPWQRLQDQSSRMFQDLNYRNEPAFITFTRSMKFGGAVELTDKPIMDVESISGRYWRIIVFHDYTGDGWTNTDNDTILIAENKRGLADPELNLRREVTQTVTLHQDLGPQRTIAAAGQPLRAGIPLRAVVSLITAEDEDEPGAKPTLLTAVPGDPSVLYSQVPLKARDSYQVVSSLTKADEESLRLAETDYPAWVAPRYLQLPDTLPERVSLLAQQITEGRETPYEKAKAIERYLRDIPYSQTIERPAPGQDGVDYFLFDIRQGYCDYYASSMVVMLRSAGIPARYVRGYSRGFKEEGVYHVLERNGHAWPEAYFPGYGWIEFEPTASEPILMRAGTQDEANSERTDDRDRPLNQPGEDEIPRGFDPGFDGPLPPAMTETFWDQAARWVGLTLSLVAFGLAFAALLLVRRRRRVEGLSITERVYQDLVEWVRRLLNITPLAHQTPYEYAGSVGNLVPQGSEAVKRIADHYVEERFGGKAVPSEEAEGAWREAWAALWRRGIVRQGARLTSFGTKLLPRRRPKKTWPSTEPGRDE